MASKNRKNLNTNVEKDGGNKQKSPSKQDAKEELKKRKLKLITHFNPIITTFYYNIFAISWNYLFTI